MATGDRRANIYNKRNMSQEAWDTYFFRFLDNKINDTTRAAFLQSGVLGDDLIGLTDNGPNKIKLDLSLEDRVCDGYGHIMDLAAYLTALGAGSIEARFENELGVVYYVGIRYQEIPNDVERNPRSSEPEYPWFRDMIGEMGNPDSVTDNSTYIRLEINGVTEASVNHSQRIAIVWLNNPVSPDDAVAYFAGLIEYSGGVNYIDIPYTPSQGPLGQTAPEYTISTDALDYTVFLTGLSWFRNTDIRTDDNYAFIGTVTGAGAGNPPTVFDLTDQRPVFLISLDRAYRANSVDDPAPGRTIYADKKAVRIRQTATSAGDEDWLNTAFRIDQAQQGGAFFSRGADIVSGYHSGAYPGMSAGWSHILSVADAASGGDLQPSEPFTTVGGTATISLTRGAVNLTSATMSPLTDDAGGGHLVRLSSTTGGALDGWYYITGGWTSSSFEIADSSFTPLVLGAGISGNAEIFFPVFGSYAQDWIDTGAAQTDKWSHAFAFPRQANGLTLSGMGDTYDLGARQWAQFTNPISDQNAFATMFLGKFVMRGGGSDICNDSTFDKDTITGHAHYQSDKYLVTGIGDHLPQEVSAEWGFDFRGASFDKDLSGDVPPYQLGYTCRMPMWWYDSGSEHVLFEEDFTRYDADELQFTRVGFNAFSLPFGPSLAHNTFMAEVVFDTPNEASSGVFFAYAPPAADRIQFMNIDGSAPSFPVGGTGVARFWGGIFTGTIYTQVGNQDAFMMNVTPPTRQTGGIRVVHSSDDAIDSSDNQLAAIFLNVDTPTAERVMFAVRDGGIVYGRAITTRNAFLQGGLTQWDQVDTALYTGDVSKITRYDLDATGQARTLDIDTDGNFIRVNPGGGGLTGLSLAQNVMAGVSTATNGLHPQVPRWKQAFGSQKGVECSLTSGESDYWYFPLRLPQGTTLTDVKISGNALVATGGAASLGFNVARLPLTLSSSPDWMGTAGAYFTTPATDQTITLTINAAKAVIDNSAYDYYVWVKSSQPSGVSGSDYVHWCEAVFDVTELGANLFYG